MGDLLLKFNVLKEIEGSDENSFQQFANDMALKYGILGTTNTVIDSLWTKKRLNVKDYLPPKKKKRKKQERRGYHYSPNADLEWLSLRRDVIKVLGTRCLCCRKKPKKTKDLHVDHVLPRSRHPHLTYDIMNLQVLCKTCNYDKSDIHATDYRTDEQRERLLIMKGVRGNCVVSEDMVDDVYDVLGDIPTEYLQELHSLLEKTKNSKVMLEVENDKLCSVVYLISSKGRHVAHCSKNKIVVREYRNWSNDNREFKNITKELLIKCRKD
jgi:5-methylcytosine-specific restriction endonuclease McrA